MKRKLKIWSLRRRAQRLMKPWRDLVHATAGCGMGPSGKIYQGKERADFETGKALLVEADRLEIA